MHAPGILMINGYGRWIALIWKQIQQNKMKDASVLQLIILADLVLMQPEIIVGRNHKHGLLNAANIGLLIMVETSAAPLHILYALMKRIICNYHGQMGYAIPISDCLLVLVVFMMMQMADICAKVLVETMDANWQSTAII